MFKFFYKKVSKGFTLVETMVAIFILSMAITSAMTVAQGSLQASFYARDRISAYFLAEEAIEMIKNKRDENGIKNFEQGGGAHWLDDIASWAIAAGPCGSDGSETCGVDANTDTIDSCDNLEDCELFINNTTGIIGHQDANATPTKFTRTIQMEEISSNEAKVTVRISWPGRPDFVISEHIFNWHPLSDLLP